MIKPLTSFDELSVGQEFGFGSIRMELDEILEFARRWDPQPFHIDPEAAKSWPFGGLIASGWHTGSLWMRLYVTSMLGSAAAMGSPGIEELRWLAPVRPGDTLTARLVVLDTTPSERNPARGTLRSRGEMVNQDGVTVMAMTSRGHFERRT